MTYLSEISDFRKAYEVNHIHIWQVSPLLSCADTCQIWLYIQQLSTILIILWNWKKKKKKKKNLTNTNNQNRENWLDHKYPGLRWCLYA